MKTAWLIRKGAEELVLFFNGWGMDERIAAMLVKDCVDAVPWDFLSCWDYRSLQPEKGFSALTEGYGRITVVAWSFGVWAALHAGLACVHRAVAINGTPKPVNDTDGIPSVIFDATLSTYSEENRQRFNRRMCGSREVFDFFSAIPSGRQTAEQREELSCLGGYVRAAAGSDCSFPWQYTHAIIGGRDMIFPACQQYHAWKGVPQTIIAEMPHFPFNHFSTLPEVLACME
ncbi:MAG: DUF452 family protein [Chlorobiaceae bacterium]|nr:DUF452 family protein [Chlorobiaceae bacterium]